MASREITLKEVFELIEKKYEYALTQKWISKPLAWAIYQVWDNVDKRKYAKLREYNRLAKQKSRAKFKEEAEKHLGGVQE